MELLEWDTRSYDALPLPHKRWGAEAMKRLRLSGDETVVDLGCGTGRDARRLLSALPLGRVIAIDGSEQMLEQARTTLAADLDRVEIVHADLRIPLSLREPADAVFSVATLHWLPDHGPLFARIAAALRQGGQFVAEAGGQGNVAAVRATLTEMGADDGSDLWTFSGVAETVEDLEWAGFGEIEVDLVPDPARLEPGAQFESFLATVVLAAHLRELAASEQRAFVANVAAMLPGPVVDYVRLQIRAVKL